MNRGLKIALISLGLITSGVLLFRILGGKTLEDNGKNILERGFYWFATGGFDYYRDIPAAMKSTQIEKDFG